ncbi:hypothetical protein LPB140_02145 [Sphingorhabdus lutea]|uniref:Uncharacterized protein n=1 Tax=Sphingorhabdus lutea TaxID=1913578 RepID=A0A1L3J9N0_9SPHN|nr:hypothetical protein [Sphingorhabdus lutea]APG61829.1 hypothetical protein LPB140_02145 [Sphingorhabdus lutea]
MKQYVKKGKPISALAMIIGGWIFCRAIIIASQSPAPEIHHAPALMKLGKKTVEKNAVEKNADFTLTHFIYNQHKNTQYISAPRTFRPIPFAMNMAEKAAGEQRAQAILYPHLYPKFPNAAAQNEPLFSANQTTKPLNGKNATTIVTKQLSSSHNDKKFSLYAYAYIRPDQFERNSSLGILSPSYGGSQAAILVKYRIISGPSGQSLSIYSRISSAIGPFQDNIANDKDASLGISYIPSPALPLSINAEYRARNNGAHGPILFAAGGKDNIKLTQNIRASGYAQAGYYFGTRQGAFGDANFKITRQVFTKNKLGVNLGGGIWAAGQYERAPQDKIARIDIGPTINFHLKPNNSNIQLSADWRMRIAGNAANKSGPAITISAGF